MSLFSPAVGSATTETSPLSHPHDILVISLSVFALFHHGVNLLTP